LRRDVIWGKRGLVKNNHAEQNPRKTNVWIYGKTKRRREKEGLLMGVGREKKNSQRINGGGNSICSGKEGKKIKEGENWGQRPEFCGKISQGGGTCWAPRQKGGKAPKKCEGRGKLVRKVNGYDLVPGTPTEK